ncbi:MAG: fused MFS/spermidine synthase [Candidatus Polarisedimenticolia bacterium]
MILLAFLAGASSLCFELLWARRLTLEAGGPLASFTIVVCGFMLGMAAGAAWGGLAGGHARHPLRRFGWAQIAGAVPAAWLSMQDDGMIVRSVLAASGASPGSASFHALMALAGTAVLLPAAVAAGATTPLLLSAGRRAQRADSVYAWLAGAQAAGGAAGALACGFVLLPGPGLRVSLALCALASLITGALALAWRSRPKASTPPRISSETAPPSPWGTAGLIPAALVLCGLSLTALEVVWARLAFLSFGSTAQAGSLVTAAAVSGLALGSLAWPRLARRFGNQGVAVLAVGAALSLLLTEPALGRLPLAGAMVARTWSGGAEQLFVFGCMFVVTALPALFIGAVFPAGFAALARRLSGRYPPAGAAGISSACSSVGTFLGAPLAWGALHAGLGARGCLIAAAGLLSAAGLLTGQGVRPRVAGVSALAIACLLALAGGWDLDLLSSGPFLYSTLYGWAEPEGTSLREALSERGPLLFAREGPEALVTVRRTPGGTLSLQVNGKTDASTGGDMKTQVLVAQLPMLLRASSPSRLQDQPRTLVIGLGSGVTAGSALTHGGPVTVVEISPEVAEAAVWFEGANGSALMNPRLSLGIEDARSRLLFDGTRYDVIISQPSNPWVAGQAALFTREFFDLVRSRLAPGGIFCQWVQGYGLRAADFRSVVATFAAVFPETTLWEESTAGGDYLLLGSLEPWKIHAAALERAMSPPVSSDLARVEVRSIQDLLAHLQAGPEQVRRLADGAPLQREDRMTLEFTARSALREETLGSILRLLEPYRGWDDGLVTARPELLAALAAQSHAAREERRWAEGLGLFEASGPRDPDLLRALSYLRAGMTDHAYDAVKSVAERLPADPLPRLILAHLAMSRGRMGEASEALAEAAAADPSNARPRLFLSRALFAAGKLPAALQVNQDVLRLKPDLPGAASDRCAMLMAAGDDAAAAPWCARAVEADPLLAEAHANAGLLHARQGRAAEARKVYERALELDPGLRDARFNLAALAEREGRADEGLRILEPLLSDGAAPDAETLRLAARMALQKGDVRSARAWIERSLQLEPASPEAQSILRRLR